MGDASVILEPVDLTHAAPLQAMAGDPAIAATTRIVHPYPPGQAERFIRFRMRERKAGLSWVFAVKNAGEVVGVCGLIDISAAGEAEIGYWIGRSHWGHGFATRAVANTLRFSFAQLKLRAVYAKCLAGNYGSQQVLGKNGFRHTGAEAHDVPHWPAGTSLLVYRITRTEWQSNA